MLYVQNDAPVKASCGMRVQDPVARLNDLAGSDDVRRGLSLVAVFGHVGQEEHGQVLARAAPGNTDVGATAIGVFWGCVGGEARNRSLA